MTKPLVAWAVLVAVEEGSVRLDGAAGPAGSTVRHLLAHASGIGVDRPEVLAPPGRRRIYSNVGFELLAAHLESATAIGWARYVTEAVLEPLGMGCALGPSAARGAVGSVEDLVRFVSEVRAPSLVSRATRDEALTTQFPTLRGVVPGVGPFDPNPWGLGVEIHGDKQPHWMPAQASGRSVGHFGATGTFWWFDPDRDVGLIGVGSRGFGPWALEVWPRLGAEMIRRHEVGAGLW